MSAESSNVWSAEPVVKDVAGGSPDADPIAVVHVFTVPIALAFIRGQTAYMRDRGVALTVITSPGPAIAEHVDREGMHVHEVPMQRRISPLADLLAVARVVRHLRRTRPDVVHAHTPKGGMVGMIAATVARTPVRIYHLRGLRYVTAEGRQRTLLRAVERLSCRLAHRVICVSPSLREVALAEGLCPAGKIVVLGGGSGNGVDAGGRFDPARVEAETRTAYRSMLGIAPDDLVLGYVGRLVRDKGIVELAGAWERLSREDPRLRLILVGPPEADDAVPPMVIERLASDPRVRLVGSVSDIAPFYAAMDVVVLPTYREGLPNVPLEAAAMGLPVVATAIPGCVDAVLDGVTGTLVPPRDAETLTIAIRAYVDDPELRRRHGEAGRARVLTEFRSEAVWAALLAEYRRLVARAEPATG